MPIFWNDPVANPYNILQFNQQTKLFSAYDEFNPRVLVGGTLNGFFLNFNQNEGAVAITGTTPVYDLGNKVIFGDLGHNWTVGANSMNDLYGGFGDDLLNTQRNLTIDNGLNDVPDNQVLANGVTFHGIAFGGAGRSTLIAGGVYDRLIDWRGEFNQYVVPFAPYGAPTVSRDVNPQLFQYLYQLSASDGADASIATDFAQDPTRNGEPYGELGLVTQVDPFWQEQGGAPNQSVPVGHIPGGSRMVIGSASFARGTLSGSGMLTVAGTWTVANGALNATPPSVGTSSFAVFDQNNYIPNYFEVTSSVSVTKATGGYKSNAYIIYDYLGPTNFKFAGVDGSTQKVELGHFDGTYWNIDAQTPAQINSNGSFYNLLLSVNGTAAILIVNNNPNWTVSYTYAAHVVNGVNIGLDYGIVGLGANNAISSFSSVAVQTVMPTTTFTYNETFTGGTAQYFDPPTSGTWTYSSGAITGTPPSSGAAVQFVDIGLALGKPAGTFALQANSTLDLKATLQIAGRAGLVYAYYNPGYYKFAALLADTQQVVLGHYTTKGGYVFDATTPWTLAAGTNYTLELTANGNTVSLTVNGSLALSYIYNSVVTSGQFGLISLKGATTFTNAYVRTDDQNVPTETIQHMDAAMAPTGPALGETALTTAELNSILNAAIERLSAALVLGASSIAELRAATIRIDDLPGLDLGVTVGGAISISRNAAGWGWFIDPTPSDDSEFPRPTANGLAATPASPAYGEMDLLTVVMHELGHVLGYPDTSSGLMSEFLLAGTRLAPPVAKPHVFDEATGTFVSHDEFVQLRGLLGGLQSGLINVPGSDADSGTTPNWIIRNVSDEGLPAASSDSGSSSVDTGVTNVTDPDVNLPDKGKLGSAIHWNKSFLGFDQKRIHSLL